MFENTGSSKRRLGMQKAALVTNDTAQALATVLGRVGKSA